MLATEKTVKISSKGQITLPRPFRDILQSDIVRIVADQGSIKIEPVRDAAGSLRRYAGRYVPFQEKNVDIVDAIVHTISKEKNWVSFSFDKDLVKLRKK